MGTVYPRYMISLLKTSAGNVSTDEIDMEQLHSHNNFGGTRSLWGEGGLGTFLPANSGQVLRRGGFLSLP